MRRFLLLGLISLLAGCANTGTLHPFTTDGCSMFPDRDVVSGKDWRCCCVAHDVAYWRGGTAAERLAADKALKACVRAATGDQALGRTMQTGVRAGGTAYLPSPFRWGYGWGYGRFYRPLTALEQAQADLLLDEYRTGQPDACMAPPAQTSGASTARP